MRASCFLFGESELGGWSETGVFGSEVLAEPRLECILSPRSEAATRSVMALSPSSAEETTSAFGSVFAEETRLR